ncbi:MAG: ATP-binding protein [Acidobacteria bacterium]|nr:ATP-binding protein [Acidobacteriota bacterium]
MAFAPLALHAQDLAWLLLFSALHFASPVRNAAEVELLVLLGLFQVISPRVVWFATPAGNLAAIAAKLVLGWLLIGVSYGIESSYFLILLLPVVSAATTLTVWGATGVTVLAMAAYLSFLLFLDWTRVTVPVDQIREISLRAIFLPLVGFLTYQLAQANRAEGRRAQQAVAELAEANQHLREAEEAVRRADRLAALGQLTAGLAHELRNPLGTIKSSSELLERRLPPGDTISQELAGFISSEVDRTNSLVTRFLEFARPLRLRLEETAVDDLLDRAVTQVLRQQNPPGAARNGEPPVHVNKNYSPDVRPVWVDRELTERVFVNLISNALEASPAGGVVTVKSREVAEGVELSVIDRGSGIAPEHRESIFNPFFTTKPEGVGLGLAIVAKIVAEHRGQLQVDSTPGEGSVFRVWLPRSGSQGASQ